MTDKFTISGPPVFGNLTFRAADGVELLRYEPNGDVYVNGEKIDNQQQIYKGMTDWFQAAYAAAAPKSLPQWNIKIHNFPNIGDSKWIGNYPFYDINSAFKEKIFCEENNTKPQYTYTVEEYTE